MIALANVFARGRGTRGRPPSLLKGVSLARKDGVLAVVGAPIDGTSLLLAVIAGLVPARSGRVEVSGKAAADARELVAHVPLDAALPDVLRVEEVCDLASAIRGEPKTPAAERLASLGLEALAKRRVRSLSPGETRAVALAIALTSRAPVLLVEEPLAQLEPVAPSRVVSLLRARAAAGATVIVTTASVRDATKLADELAVMTQGFLAPLPPSLAHVGSDGARLRIVTSSSGAAALVGALAEDPAIASVETSAFSGDTRANGAASAVLVSGRDLLAVAGAVAAASTRTGIDVEAIESAVAPLDAIRAMLAAPRGPTLPSRPPPAPPVPPAASVPPAPSVPPPSVPPPSVPPPSGGAA
jgi:ABC-type nitrate/sulfonate/bicarbonate transport system ATPase subunit